MTEVKRRQTKLNLKYLLYSRLALKYIFFFFKKYFFKLTVTEKESFKTQDITYQTL